MGQGGHVYGTGLKGWGFKRFRAPPYPSSGRPRLWDGIDGVRFVNGFHTPGGVGEVFRAAGWEV